MKKYILVFLMSLSLGGCTWITDYFGGDSNEEPPKPLAEIKNAIEIEQVWSVTTGKGSGEQLLRLTPAIDSDKVYVASRDGNLIAYNVSNGEKIWEKETGKKISAGPGVGEGLVLVGTRNAEVIAFQIADGKQLWSAKVSSEVLSVPVVSDDTVAVRTADGRVLGLSAQQGKQLWSFYKREPSLTLRGTSKPVIVNGMVISGFDNGQMIAMGLKDGRQIWRRKLAIPRGRTELERIVDLDADPVVDKGVIYVAAFQGKVSAIRQTDGQLFWQRDLSAYNSLSVNKKSLFVTDATSQVWSLHTVNGASLWRQDQLQYRSLTAPAVMGNYVVVGDFEGYLHWLSLEDGHLAARMRGDSDGFSVAPVISGNMLISYGRDGGLTAFKVNDNTSK